jgi:hypothetical protein
MASDQKPLATYLIGSARVTLALRSLDQHSPYMHLHVAPTQRAGGDRE